MTKYKELMSHICSKSEKYVDMVEYRIALEELLYKIEKYYPDMYNEFISKLEDIVYEIPLEEAKKKVISMKPFGEHWSYDVVKNYIESKDIYRDCVKYYLVMNSMYNDYYEVAVNFGHQDDVEFYYELSKAFINDVDGKKHKVEKYYM